MKVKIFQNIYEFQTQFNFTSKILNNKIMLFLGSDSEVLLLRYKHDKIMKLMVYL